MLLRGRRVRVRVAHRDAGARAAREPGARRARGVDGRARHEGSACATRAGAIVVDEDVGEFAAAVTRVLTQPDLRRRLAAAARGFVCRSLVERWKWRAGYWGCTASYVQRSTTRHERARCTRSVPQLEQTMECFAIQAIDEIGQRFRRSTRRAVALWGLPGRSVVLCSSRSLVVMGTDHSEGLRGRHNPRRQARSRYVAVTITAPRESISPPPACGRLALAAQRRTIERESLVAHARVREAHRDELANIRFVHLAHVERVEAEARDAVALRQRQRVLVETDRGTRGS